MVNAHRVPEAGRLGQPHHDGVARPGEVERCFPDAPHRAHGEPTAHVQTQRLQVRPERDHGRSHPAIECGGVPVEVPDFDALVDQIEIVGGSVAAAEDALGVALLGREESWGDSEARYQCHPERSEGAARFTSDIGAQTINHPIPRYARNDAVIIARG